MTQAISAVTPARFDEAPSYADYLTSLVINRDQFEHYTATAQLSKDDVVFFSRIAELSRGPARMLVIAEAWCPDVYRGVPVFAKIAEAAGITMKVVGREDNPDIMNEFLMNGTARAVPVAVFYMRDHRYIAHWIERPAVGHVEVARIKAEFAAAHPDVNLKAPGPDGMQTVKGFFDTRLPQHYPEWQRETVREIRELLAAAVSGD
jgi:hypothetical protein